MGYIIFFHLNYKHKKCHRWILLPKKLRANRFETKNSQCQKQKLKENDISNDSKRKQKTAVIKHIKKVVYKKIANQEI